MKTNINNRTIKKSKENKIEIKKCFQILLLVFTITVLTIALSADKIIKEVEANKENLNEYVSVFLENDLEKLLFDSNEN